ncbi:unnamed protein product [Paramecium sonneborni]|uniref:Uncharacterized protein n=1 Tax=Paramecium sonneborni TaxID=65129 RepID=A0A8S1PM80_9CILI|nr:unnamed protein product [Paramecium sonneborni]
MENEEKLILVNLIKGDTTYWVAEKCEDFYNFFESMPQEITNFKKKYILDNVPYNSRFIMLCIGTIGLATLTWRRSLFRNSVLSFIGGGVFFIPETFNPYLFFKK